MASWDAFENDGQDYHTWNNTRTESLGGSLNTTRFPINFNRYVMVMEYPNTIISVVNLAQMTSEQEEMICKCIRLFRNVG